MPTVVPVEDSSEEKLYFVARGSPGRVMFYSRGLNEKTMWSVKPGIAIQAYGGAQLIATFKKHADINLVAIEVPADAATRWRARKRRFKTQRWG